MSRRRLLKTASEVFAPQLDWWLAFLVGAVVVVALSGIVLIARSGASWLVQLVATIGSIGISIYLIDAYFFLQYRLTPAGLEIHTQLRHRVLAYRQIRDIRSVGWRGLASGFGVKRYALSHRGLWITLEQAEWPAVSISPRASQSFINSLLAHIDAERSERAARNAPSHHHK